jgi:peptide/nickel transport system permease protein
MRRDAVVGVASIWLVLMLALAVTGDRFAPYDPNATSLTDRLLPLWTVDASGALHILGTDTLGRDFLSQIIVAARASIGIGLGAAILSTVIGLVVGSIAGYMGGRTDTVISRIVDVQMSFPGLLFALLILVSLGPSVWTIILVLAFVALPIVVRLARSLAISLKQTLFVDAARALGGSSGHILRRHIMPNLVSPVLVLGSVNVATLMLASASLDFLGLGLQPPATSWGRLVATGKESIQVAPRLVVLPGIAIMLTAMAVNIVAMRLREKPAIRASQRLRGARTPSGELDIEPAPGGVGVIEPAADEQLVAMGDSALPMAVRTVEVSSGNRRPTGRPSTATEMQFAAADAPRILKLDNVCVGFEQAVGVLPIAIDVSWSVSPGQTLAIVGESGSGKSVTARAIMGTLEQPGIVTDGRILYRGVDLLGLDARSRRRLNGRDLAMVPQDAISAMNPAMTVGKHLDEVLHHSETPLSKAERAERSLDLLARVGIPDPRRKILQHSFQLSGGMCQRVMIALAIANRPKVLIADEPTTALDASVQAQVLDLLDDLKREYNLAVVLVTHDFGVVAERADRVTVMYAGRVMESGSVEQVVHEPANPYTQALVNAIPDGTGRSLKPIPGTPPRLTSRPPGCAFAPRCGLADAECEEKVPSLVELKPGQLSRCIRSRVSRS